MSDKDEKSPTVSVPTAVTLRANEAALRAMRNTLIPGSETQSVASLEVKSDARDVQSDPSESRVLIFSLVWNIWDSDPARPIPPPPPPSEEEFSSPEKVKWLRELLCTVTAKYVFQLERAPRLQYRVYFRAKTKQRPSTMYRRLRDNGLYGCVVSHASYVGREALRYYEMNKDNRVMGPFKDRERERSESAARNEVAAMAKAALSAPDAAVVRPKPTTPPTEAGAVPTDDDCQITGSTLPSPTKRQRINEHGDSSTLVHESVVASTAKEDEKNQDCEDIAELVEELKRTIVDAKTDEAEFKQYRKKINEAKEEEKKMTESLLGLKRKLHDALLHARASAEARKALKAELISTLVGYERRRGQIEEHTQRMKTLCQLDNTPHDPDTAAK